MNQLKTNNVKQDKMNQSGGDSHKIATIKLNNYIKQVRNILDDSKHQDKTSGSIGRQNSTQNLNSVGQYNQNTNHNNKLLGSEEKEKLQKHLLLMTNSSNINQKSQTSQSRNLHTHQTIFFDNCKSQPSLYSQTQQLNPNFTSLDNACKVDHQKNLNQSSSKNQQKTSALNSHLKQFHIGLYSQTMDNDINPNNRKSQKNLLYSSNYSEANSLNSTTTRLTQILRQNNVKNTTKENQSNNGNKQHLMASLLKENQANVTQKNQLLSPQGIKNIDALMSDQQRFLLSKLEKSVQKSSRSFNKHGNSLMKNPKTRNTLLLRSNKSLNQINQTHSNFELYKLSTLQDLQSSRVNQDQVLLRHTIDDQQYIYKSTLQNQRDLETSQTQQGFSQMNSNYIKYQNPISRTSKIQPQQARKVVDESVSSSICLETDELHIDQLTLTEKLENCTKSKNKQNHQNNRQPYTSDVESIKHTLQKGMSKRQSEIFTFRGNQQRLSSENNNQEFKVIGSQNLQNSRQSDICKINNTSRDSVRTQSYIHKKVQLQKQHQKKGSDQIPRQVSVSSVQIFKPQSDCHDLELELFDDNNSDHEDDDELLTNNLNDQMRESELNNLDDVKFFDLDLIPYNMKKQQSQPQSFLYKKKSGIAYQNQTISTIHRQMSSNHSVERFQQEDGHSILNNPNLINISSIQKQYFVTK
eukprot:403357844